MFLPLFNRLDLDMDEYQPCGKPECTFLAGPYWKEGAGPSLFCTEHNRCRFCAYPSCYAEEICARCEDIEDRNQRPPCAREGCTHIALQVASPYGSLSRFCFSHNICPGCKKQHSYSDGLCCDCQLDVQCNRVPVEEVD